MIHIFLPAFNESIALPRLVDKFIPVMKTLNEPYRFVVFDDGSADETRNTAYELAARAPVEVLYHEKNQGLGPTMQDGMAYLIENTGQDDWIVTLDCDDTHEPRYLPAAFEKMRQGYDVVILSRYAKGGGQEGLSSIKTFLSMGAGLFLKALFPIKGIREYSCNFRVIRASILKKAGLAFGSDLIRLTHLGFVATPELLIKLRMVGARMIESPFVLQYQQKPTPSTNRSLRTIRGYFALAWHYWMRKAPKTPTGAST